MSSHSPHAAWPAARPLLVGERLNAQGSRRCRQFLLEDNHEGLVAIAREQLALGAEALDVCVALPRGSGNGEREHRGTPGSAGRPAGGDQGSAESRTGRDEAGRMIALVTRLADAVSVPIFIDSADPAVLQAALPCAGARGAANSVTLARGHHEFESLATLVREQSARLVVLCIDEQGMAVSTDRKLAIVRRLRELSKRLEIGPQSLIVDPLTFPVAIGPAERRRGAADTLTAIRQLKELWPELQIILGISDVSFGLPAALRPVLNAVFLHHAIGAGLDIAIVNVATRREYQDLSSEERDRAEDLLFDRRPDALERFTASFR